MAKSDSVPAWWRCLLPVLALSSAVSGAVIERQASGSSLELPQKPTIYKLSPSDFNKTADEAIEKELAIVAEIAAIAYDDATFNNTIQAYADFSSEKKIILSSLQPYMAMGPTAELRQAANEALIRVADVELTVSLNEAFFALVEKIHKQFEQEGKLDTPEGILTLGLWSGFLSNGINLPAGPQRDRLTDITQEINDLQFQFEGNVQADNTTLWFTKDELDGLGEAELDALPPGEGENSGKFGILLVSTQETGLIKGYVKNENTRRIADYERQRIVPQNVDILKKAVGLRDEFARIQNYSNYASFIIDNSTFQAQSAQEVNDLLKDLQTRLAPVAEKELDEITAAKKEYNASATTAYDWDAGYYSSLILRQKYNLSNGEKDQWFPAENTVMEVLNIYSDVYGFDFMRVQGDDLSRLSPTGNAGDLFWEEDVRLYTVWDEPVDGKDPEFAGYLYLDLYRREGKSAGAYMMPLEPGYIIPGGDRHYPVVALATNFKRAGEDSDTPSLLTGNDLVNILHELGHGMHHLSCRVRFGDQCGILGTPLDFSEMPSQMMENFYYNETILTRLSKHWSYLDDASKAIWEQQNPGTPQPPEKIPTEITTALIGSKDSMAASDELRQIWLSVYDMQIHGLTKPEDADTINVSELMNRDRLDITKFPSHESLSDPPDFLWGNFETTFTHIMDNYVAKYWAYTWSRVNAKDVFYTRFAQDPLSKTTGREFREKVLAPGSSRNLTSLYVDFLGRPPNNQAYLKDLGLDM